MFHVELAPLGGIFGPLKSDLGVFWPFRGTDFIMGKNKNANFSKRAHGPIFKFCVVICEAILQKMAPILDPVNFFSVLTLLGNCGWPSTLMLPMVKNVPTRFKVLEEYEFKPSLHRFGNIGPTNSKGHI